MEIFKRAKNAFHHLARREFALLCGIVAAFLCLWIFLGVAEEAGEGEHDNLELKIIQSFRSPTDLSRLKGPVWAKEAAIDSSTLGGSTLTIIITVLVASYLLINRQRRDCIIVAAAVSSGSAASVVLKHVFERPRPTAVPYLVHVNDASFPSGHSMTSAVVYITLGVLLARSTNSWKHKLFYVGTGLILSGLVGLSRVMLGVHYPSDVIAGWAAGASWALICWIAAELVPPETTRKPRIGAQVRT